MKQNEETLSVGIEMDFDDNDRLSRFGEALSEIWKYRELLYFLVWKDIKIKYKQTTLGIVWAVLQPLFGSGLFTLVFGKLAKLPSDGIAYPLFYFAALLTWTYFSTALTMASNSVVGNASIVTKIYFPRFFLPAAAVVSSLLDLVITFVLFFGLIVFYHVPVTPMMAFLPLILLLLVVFTLGAGLFLGALNVNFRDVRHALPFVMQVWLFASPVVYPASLIPVKYQWLIYLNPIAGIIEATRALVAGRSLPWEALGVSSIIVIVVLVLGLLYFRRTERRFADVI